jgi:hypothetical protein
MAIRLRRVKIKNVNWEGKKGKGLKKNWNTGIARYVWNSVG